MRRSSQLLVFLFACGLSVALTAQTFGIGGTLPLENVFPNRQAYTLPTLPSSPLISLPLYRDGQWMIEPAFGMTQRRDEENIGDAATLKTVDSIYLLHCAFRYNLGDSTFRHGPGFRVGINYVERAQTFNQESTRVSGVTRNQVLGVMYYAEYFLNPACSLGGEAQLSYTKLDPSSEDSMLTQSRLIQLSMHVTLRWYFLH